MFNIQEMILQKGALLAPMAGVTDRAFREVCKSFQASCFVSEMVSSKALVMGDKKTPNLMKNTEGIRPFGIQVFGDDPRTIGLSCSIIEQFSPDFIDINAGCPAPKITGNGGGSTLLKTPELVGEIIQEMKKVTNLPITLKIRKGFNEDYLTAVQTAKIAEQAGASMITVHGRTREQMYAPPVDWECIKEVKESVSIPVIGNGDIQSIEDYLKIKEYTGVDGVMIGRGALGRPWVFMQIAEYLKEGVVISEPEIEEKMNIMKNHIDLICRYKGEYVGMKEARKHCGWYMKGLQGAAELRGFCGKLSTLEDVDRLISCVLKKNQG